MSVESAGQNLNAALIQMIAADRKDLADQVTEIAHRLDVIQNTALRELKKVENPQEEISN